MDMLFPIFGYYESCYYVHVSCGICICISVGYISRIELCILAFNIKNTFLILYFLTKAMTRKTWLRMSDMDYCQFNLFNFMNY